MKKKKPYKINYISVGDDSASIIRNLVKIELEKVLIKHNATVLNLDEVLLKYIQ